MRDFDNNSRLIIGIEIDVILNNSDNHYIEEVANMLAKQYSENNDEIHIITNVKNVTNNNHIGKQSRKMVEKWLINNNFKSCSIQYCSDKYNLRDKLLACKKLHIDVMIDDKTDVAMHLAENDIKVILINAPYNKDAMHKNIIRVNDLLEAKALFDNLRKIDANESNFLELTYREINLMTDAEKKEYYENYYRYLKAQSLMLDEKDLNKGKKAYRIIYKLLYPIIKLGFNPIIEQKENIPYQAGKIICSNHVRLSDYYLIYLGLGIEQYCAGFMAAEIKRTIGGKFFNWMRSAAFIDRENAESRKSTSRELTVRNVYGDNIIVFPEGTRKDKTEEGKKKTLLPFHKGAVVMAKKTGTCILPMAIYYGKRTRITYGELFYVSPTDDVLECTEKLQNIIRGMVEQMMLQDTCQLE